MDVPELLSFHENSLNGTFPIDLSKLSKLSKSCCFDAIRRAFVLHSPAATFCSNKLLFSRAVTILQELFRRRLVDWWAWVSIIPISYTQSFYPLLTLTEHCPIVVDLQLLDNNWSGTIPSELGLMTSLSKLIVPSYVLIVDTCSSYSGISNAIESLLLSGPSMSGTIPSEIGKLSSLGELPQRRHQGHLYGLSLTFS